MKKFLLSVRNQKRENTTEPGESRKQSLISPSRMDLKKLLEERDFKEKRPFENLIHTKLESALILVDSLKTSLRRNRLLQQKDQKEDSSDGGNLVLEAKLKELKDERAELYRQQGTQATHLLTLNDQLRNRDTLITSLNTEIATLKQSQEQKEEEVKNLREKVKEGEEGAKIIGDELVALQLELLRLDQWQNKTTKTEEKCKEKQNENEEKEEISSDVLNLNFNDNNLKLVKEKEIVAPHQYPISSYTSNPTSRQLLTGSEDQKIILYDLTRISTKMVLKWSKMNGPIVSLAVEDGLVASCSAYDKEVTIWSISSGKIQGTLQFTDDSTEVPLLRFGAHSRLWMSLSRSVRLWDFQRGLLLRSWNRDLIPNSIQSIMVDQKRPDRLWCFDDKASFTILNAVTGKLEIPWKSVITDEIKEEKCTIYYDCSMERILMGRCCDEDWIITGYSRNATGLDGIFEFSLRNDLLKIDLETKVFLKSVSIHPDRPDLIALILADRVLFVKVSLDHWKPETLSIDCDDCDSVQWGPPEDDPINGEKGCKVILIGKESKRMQLFTFSRI